MNDIKPTWEELKELRTPGIPEIKVRTKSNWFQILLGFLLNLFRKNKSYKKFYSSFYIFFRPCIYVPTGEDKKRILSPVGMDRTDLKRMCHEITHINDMHQVGRYRFAWTYVTNQRARAMYEADAYLTALLIDYFLGVPIENMAQSHVESITRKLTEHYSVDAWHTDYVEDYLWRTINLIDKGSYTDQERRLQAFILDRI